MTENVTAHCVLRAFTTDKNKIQSLIEWFDTRWFSAPNHTVGGGVVGSATGYLCGVLVQDGELQPADPDRVQQAKDAGEEVVFVAPGVSAERVTRLLQKQLRFLEEEDVRKDERELIIDMIEDLVDGHRNSELGGKTAEGAAKYIKYAIRDEEHRRRS